MPSRTVSVSRRPWLQGCLVATVVLLASGGAPGLAASQTLWGEIPLPGGVKAARAVFALGLAEDRPDGAWLADYLLRQLNAVSVLAPVPIEQYLATLETAATLQAEWPDGLLLPAVGAPEPVRVRAENALRALGLLLRRRGNQYQAEPDRSSAGFDRVASLEAAGVDVDEVALTLNSGRPAAISLSHSRLPLPLPDYWTKYVFTRKTSPLLSIVGSRPHSLVYLGLLAQDEPTLAFLHARPDLVRRLGDDVGGAFATFGRSLRVRNNAVEAPGGPDAAGVWRELVGRDPGDAEPFIMSLLARDDGRLAYFYDTVAQLPPGRQRSVLGAGRSGADRLQFVKRIAAHFAAAHAQWKVERLPFSRSSFDPAVALMLVDVQPDGSLGPAWLPAVLDRVVNTSTWPMQPDQTFGSVSEGSANALWMLDWVFEKPGEAPARFALLRFAQRRFAAVPKASAHHVGVALLTSRDMPALTRALERMSVSDPAVYAAVAVAAYNLTVSGGADEVRPILARWQAALGLLEQAQRRLRLPEEAVVSLLQSLVRATPADRRQAPGVVAAWLLEHLLPRLVPDGPLDELEPRTVRALTTQGAPGPVRFSWEGLQYVADTSQMVFRSVRTLRDTEAREPTLTDLARLHAVRRTVERASLDNAGQVAAALNTLNDTLGWLAAAGERGARVVRDLREATGQLDRIRDVRDANRLSRPLEPLLEAIDLTTDLVVSPLVYALALSPTREPAAVYQEAWRVHSLAQSPSRTFGAWTETAWQSPEVDARPGGGLMLRGAMLSVDVALVDALLMRAVPPAARGRYLLNQERDTLLRYLAYAHTDTFAGDSALIALEAARRQAQVWATEIPAPQVLHETLRGAGVSAWRANVFAWEAHHAGLELGAWLTPFELLRLRPETLAAFSWHGPAPPSDGCHCLRRLEVPSPEELRGRESGVLVALVPNLPLRLGEHLRALDLPVSLVPLLLPVAIQDWIDGATQSGPEDWYSSAGWLRRLSRERVEEYLLSLISAGALAPPSLADTQ